MQPLRTCSTTFLVTLHDPAYRHANTGALRMEWPRIPLPGWPDGESEGAARRLIRSAARGRKLARLLNPDTPVPGVTDGALRPELAAIAVPATADGRNMNSEDFAVTAGWGHSGTADAVMPGQGRAEATPVHPVRTRRAPRYRLAARPNDLRPIFESKRVLAQRPGCCLDVQARRLSGAQEMAVLS